MFLAKITKIADSKDIYRATASNISATQPLPVYCHLLLVERGQERSAVLGQAAAQLFLAECRHQALESVVGRGRVVAGKEAEASRVDVSELAHVHVVLAAQRYVRRDIE